MMHNLTKSNADSDQLCGYLWAESHRGIERFTRVFACIFLGIIGSCSMSALFVARTIGTGAWIVGFLGVFLIAVIVIAWQRAPDLNAIYCLSRQQIATHSRQKKYEKIASWDEIVDVAEVVCVMSHALYTRECSSYLLLMKKPHIELIELGILAADHGKQNMIYYRYLYRQPDIIAIPKTEETVSFIAQFKTIR